MPNKSRCLTGVGAALVVAVLLLGSGQLCAQDALPRDKDGWTVFKPSPDSRIVYVSSTDGNDATGKAYGPADGAVGEDPFHPVGPVEAFKTIAAAMENARDEHPDWVLLKRGDEWRESLGLLPSGRSTTEPFLVSAYGDRLGRPVLTPRSNSCFSLDGRTGFHDIAIVGLEFYAEVMDPNSPRFNAGARRPGMSIYMRQEGVGRRLLVEDCLLRHIQITAQTPGGRLEELVFRRNLILDSYSHRGHAQGMFAKGVSVLLEENVFDHNGWRIQQRPEGGPNATADGQATYFNHNTYFCNCHDTAFRGNMFLRGSSGGNKWTANSGPGSARNLVMDNNLYVEGEAAISAGGNRPGPLRFKNVAITNNVLLHIGRARPTNRRLGWYLWISDWDGGVIAGNLLIHQMSDELTNVYGIHIGTHATRNAREGEGVHFRNVAVRDNIIHGLKSASAGLIITQSALFSDMSIAGNTIQFPGLQGKLVTVDGALSGFSFADNTYYSDGDPAGLFAVGREGMDFNAWVAASGEKGSEVRKVAFADPNRTVETYNASLGGEATLDAFIAEVRKQSKTNWRKEYTAAAVNDYIREGFKPVADSKERTR